MERLEEQNAKVRGRNDRMKDSRKKFLLAQTELFAHFLNSQPTKLTLSPKKKPSAGSSSTTTTSTTTTTAGPMSPTKGRRGRVTEEEEDQKMMETAEEEVSVTRLTTQPHCIAFGTMRDYQLEGLNWMINLHDNGISGILADEMGLGKTLQTISLLGYLKEARGVDGPHLVIVPKSTIGNWMNEFKRWCPSLRVFKMYGNKAERADIAARQFIAGNFDVVVTSYEMILIERAVFNKFEWEYIAIDEAHRIKNENSRLSEAVRFLNSHHRLLITGTPLQNNLHELWALLNFLLPDVFASADSFDEWFDLSSETAKDDAVEQLHKVLRPFLLRRLKDDVEDSLLPKREILLHVGLTAMQKEWYRKLLSRDIDAINSSTKGTSKTRLLNIVMQLRKCCNHPYLFEGAEPGPPYTTDYHLVKNSGKMVLLDKLLDRLKTQGSRVLIFSQFTRLLDILEDYLLWRGHEYCRIDGQTKGDERDEYIETFNAEGSSKFVFLLSTRAGGLGINLATADTVIIYDSDWNPQMDLQAMDRAHRIGQKKQVNVYRFCARDTIEEKIIERAQMKLHLDALVIQQGRIQEQNRNMSKDEVLSMIKFGADVIFNSAGSDVTEEDLDAILARGESITQELSEKIEAVGANALRDFKLSGDQSAFTTNVFEGVDYSAEAAANLAGDYAPTSFINLGKRKARDRTTYNINQYYADALRAEPSEKKKRAPRPPKMPNISDFQFYPPQLKDLLARELWAWRFEHAQEYVSKYVEEDLGIESEEERAIKLAELREMAQPLTDEEKETRDAMLEQGFSSWSRIDFARFYHGCEDHGRQAYAAIAKDVETKTEEQVEAYAKVFFERGPSELENWDRVIEVIEKGEAKMERHSTKIKLIRQVVAEASGDPYETLAIKTKSSSFTPAEDRYIIAKIHELGYGEWDKLRLAIRDAWEFRFDWFFKSRTPAELHRRCDSLLRAYEKSIGGNTLAIFSKKSKSSKSKKSKSKSKSSSSSSSSKRKRPSSNQGEGEGEGEGEDEGGRDVKKSKGL